MGGGSSAFLAGFYIREIKRRTVDPHAYPEIRKECVSSAVVCGNSALGPIVAKYAMDLAMKKAHRTGIGIVSVSGGNYYGAGNYYVLQAANSGYIGICCTNSPPVMVPTRAKDGAIGSNPITFGAPGLAGDNLCIDMALTTVTLDKIEQLKDRGESLPSLHWAMDNRGEPTENSKKAFKARRLFPLGGPESEAGHKGYALAMMVECLCGILSGARYGPQIQHDLTENECEKIPPKPANLGQCFIAINPKFFEPGYEKRMAHIMSCMRNMEPRDPSKPVLVPGDHEKLHMKKIERRGGVSYNDQQMKSFTDLAKDLDVQPPKLVEPNVTVE